MLPNLCGEGRRESAFLSGPEAHTQPQACPRHPEWPPLLAWEVSHCLQYLFPSPAVPSLGRRAPDWWSRSPPHLHAGKEQGSHLGSGREYQKYISSQTLSETGGAGGGGKEKDKHPHTPSPETWEDERQWLRTLESNTFLLFQGSAHCCSLLGSLDPDCAPPLTKALSRRGVKVAVRGGGGGTPLLEEQCGHKKGSGVRVREVGSRRQRLFSTHPEGLSRDRLTRPGTCQQGPSLLWERASWVREGRRPGVPMKKGERSHWVSLDPCCHQLGLEKQVCSNFSQNSSSSCIGVGNWKP